MVNNKSYRLYVQPYLKVMIFGVLVLFTIIGLLMVTGLLSSAKGDGPPRLFGLFWLGMIGWYWYWILSVSHTIVVSESGQVDFIGVVRKRRTTMREILSVKSDTQFGFLMIKTSSGKIRILNQFDEFHDFIIQLKAANPGVELRGC
jgi:hypothetical protein